MTDVLEFLSGLLDGLGLLALGVSIGGIAYALVVLRVLGRPLPGQESLNRHAIQATLFGIGALGGCRLVQLLLKALALADSTGTWAVDRFFHTHVFWFSTASIGLSALLAIGLLGIRRRPASRWRWFAVLGILAGFLFNEGWLSHAASRLEGRETLMALTTLHILAAAVWSGGVIHLLLSWQVIRPNTQQAASVWPQLITRFSPLGMTSMAIIIAAGGFLAWRYIGHMTGLVGTGYGNMVLVKIGLLTGILLLAALNFMAGRRRSQEGGPLSLDVLTRLVPVYIEVEIVLAAAVMFSASALTSLPPTVDVLEAVAGPTEVWRMVSPKVPHLAGPEQVLIEAPELIDLRTGQMGYKLDMSWDRFNHNISGVIVLALACLALLDWSGRHPWSRHWPMLFVAFSLLIVVFANPDHWPLGSIGFVESLKSTEVIQHWLAGGVVFGLGWFEWRARQGSLRQQNFRFIFPILCMVGGIILLTHSHSINELKTEFLVQSTHVAMGLLGVIAGCGRWLELRLAAPQARTAGLISIAAMMCVGWILLFYVNPEIPGTLS